MSASPFIYSAAELFAWLCHKPDFVLLDVRNDKEFANWSVEAPRSCPYINIPYYNFIENVQESIDLVPAGEKVRVVCSKEGSAKYVADLLCEKGFTDVGYMAEGIVGWRNALIPRPVTATDAAYQLYQVARPGKASLSYLLCSQGEAFVFDAARNVDVYMDVAKEQGCQISKTFETHRQADYISGCQLLQQEAAASIMASPIDFAGADFDYQPVNDGDSFQCGDVMVRALHTPGHTLGSTCYLVDDKYLLSGDTLFIEAVGRPDLGGKWEDWSRVLYLTLALKFRDLSDQLLVLPAHFTNWRDAGENLLFAEELGYLKKEVDAFSLSNELKFKEFIRDNIRPQPAVYAEIRRVNGGWLKPSPEEADIMDLGKNECSASNYGKQGVSAESQRQTEQ